MGSLGGLRFVSGTWVVHGYWADHGGYRSSNSCSDTDGGGCNGVPGVLMMKMDVLSLVGSYFVMVGQGAGYSPYLHIIYRYLPRKSREISIFVGTNGDIFYVLFISSFWVESSVQN